MFSAGRSSRRRSGSARTTSGFAEFVGGGFGSKPVAGFEGLAAAELARITGRPVRLVNDRHAEQLDGGRRGATRQTVRLGARLTGRSPRSRRTRSSQGQGGWVMPVLIPARTLYRCADVRAMTFLAKTNLRAQNAFRAPGVMEGTAAFEQAMDELALALGLDPLELRRRNHDGRRPGERAAVLEQAAPRLLRPGSRACRLGARDALREPQPDGLLRGMGCATQIWWGGGGPPSHATVRLDAEGHAHVVTGIQDIGTGTLTGAQMVAAEELGLPLERRSRHRGRHRPERLRTDGGWLADDAVGDARGPSASAKVRKTLLQLASDVFEIAAEDLEVRDGRIRSHDGAIDAAVTEVTEKLGERRSTAPARGDRTRTGSW